MKLTIRCPDCRQSTALHLTRTEQRELSRRLVIETTCTACGNRVELQLSNGVSIAKSLSGRPPVRTSGSATIEGESFAPAPPPRTPDHPAAAPAVPAAAGKSPSAWPEVVPDFPPAPTSAVPAFLPMTPAAPPPAGSPDPSGGTPSFAPIGADGPRRRTSAGGRWSPGRITEDFSRRPKWQQYAILAVLFLFAFGILMFPSKPPSKRRRAPQPAVEGAVPTAATEAGGRAAIDGPPEEADRSDVEPGKAAP